MTAIARQRSRGQDLVPTAPAKDARHDRRSRKPIRRESKLTLGGLVYIGVTVFLAIGAINSQNNLLFWLFGVSIATLIVSGLFSGNALMRVRLEAQSVPDARAGEPIRLKYSIRNHSRFFPLFASMVTEIPPANLRARFQPAAVMHLGPGQTDTFYGELTPLHRGRHTIRTIRLSTRFPFGLLQKSLVFEQARTVLVLPCSLNIKPELVRIIHGHGDEIRKHSATSGVSNEFWGLREYRPGDSPRSIAWKHSAKRHNLVVIEHARPIATRLWVWVADPKHPAAGDETSHERAIALAAALVSKGIDRGIPVGLWYPSHGLRIPSAIGRGHKGRCLRALATLDLDREPESDAPPPAGNIDEVIAITADQHRPHLPKGGRILSVRDPASWLIDPASLPIVLGGER
ncbi:MAG: DUF58 domain-containing protein [Phycisphaerales bacterium]